MATRVHDSVPSREELSVFRPFIKRWNPRSSEHGQNLVEYGLLIGLLAIVIIVSLLYLGPLVSQMFQNVGTTLS